MPGQGPGDAGSDGSSGGQMPGDPFGGGGPMPGQGPNDAGMPSTGGGPAPVIGGDTYLHSTPYQVTTPNPPPKLPVGFVGSVPKAPAFVPVPPPSFVQRPQSPPPPSRRGGAGVNAGELGKPWNEAFK